MNVKKYLLVVLVTTLLFATVVGCFGIFYVITNPLTRPLEQVEGDDGEIRGLTVPKSGEARNILLLGLDYEAHLTDVIMLCRVDPVTNKVNIMSIPRDTKVKVKGETMKINASYSTGGRGEEKKIEQIIATVKSLTGVEIHHYFRINTKAFRDCIDAVGGVYFDVPQNMHYEDPLQNLYIHLSKGYQHLDGNKAEQLVRFRQYALGDVRRIQVQQEFLGAIIDQHLKLENVLRIPEIYNIIISNSYTDMTGGDVLSLGYQVLKIGGSNIESFTLPGHLQDGVSYYFCDYDETDKIVATHFKDKEETE